MSDVLVGRDQEQAVASELLRGARSGTPQPLLITGEPGSGKTSLLRNIIAEAEDSGFRIVLARADPADAGVPYAALRLTLGPALENEDSPDLAGVAASLGEVLQLAPGGDPAHRVDVVELLRRLVEGWAFKGPVVFAVDDLHAADADTAAAVVYLMRHIRRHRVLVAATSRRHPPDLDPELADHLWRFQRDGLLDALELGPLGDRDVGQLIELRTGAPAVPAVLDALRVRTSGNPFFVVELLDALESADMRADPVSAAPTLPHRVTTAVLHRVFQLGTDARQVASAAAVFGRLPLHRLPLLGSMTELSAGRTEAAFDRLVGARILVADADGFRFAHDIVREALYEDLGPAQRRRLHQQAAELLAAGRAAGDGTEIAEVASHVMRATAGRDSAAATVLVEAGDESVNRAPRTAAMWYREALDRLDPSDRATPAARVKLSRALTFSAHYAEAAAVAAAAAEALPVGSERARAALFEAWALFGAGRIDEAGAVLDEVLGEPAMRSVRLLLNRAQVAFWQDRLPDVRRLLADATTVGLERDQAIADSLVMLLHTSAGKYRAAAELASRLRQAGAASASPIARVNILLAVAQSSAFNGDPAVAVADADAVDDMGAQAAWFQTCETLALYRLGRWDDAVRTAERARTTIEGRGGETATGILGSVLAVVRAERGDLAGAAAALLLAEAGAAPAFRVIVDWSSAVVHTVKGEHRLAIDILTNAAAREEQNQHVNFLAMALAQLVETAADGGDPATAQSANDRLQALPRDEAGVAATMWCLLADAITTEDAEAATAAREHALRYDLRFDAARALARLGAIRNDAGLLVDAYDELGALGAVHRQPQVAVHLRRLGRRAPRRSRTSALTPVEAQIADLLATGMTNRQIADKAALSPKTVEVYLSRIYAKTGCRSRLELALAVNTGALPAT